MEIIHIKRLIITIASTNILTKLIYTQEKHDFENVKQKKVKV